MCPIMVDGKGGGGGPPHPAGVFQMVCSWVVDIGETYSERYNKWKHQVVINFESSEAMDDGRPWVINARYTASLRSKSTLRALLQSWRGRPFTEAEIEGFDLEKLIGANATVNVIHNPREGGGHPYGNIASISPVMRGLPKLAIRFPDPPEWVLKVKANNEAAQRHRAAAEGGAIDGPGPDFDADQGAANEEALPF